MALRTEYYPSDRNNFRLRREPRKTLRCTFEAGGPRSDRRGGIECHPTLGTARAHVDLRDSQACRHVSQHRQEVPASRRRRAAPRRDDEFEQARPLCREALEPARDRDHRNARAAAASAADPHGHAIVVAAAHFPQPLGNPRAQRRQVIGRRPASRCNPVDTVPSAASPSRASGRSRWTARAARPRARTPVARPPARACAASAGSHPDRDCGPRPRP